MRAVGVATLNANSVKKQSINARRHICACMCACAWVFMSACVSRLNVADWQYLGVDKITRILEWNSGRKARKGHICEDSLAYASYSSKDIKVRDFITVMRYK